MKKILITISLLFLNACALQAPLYQPSVQNGNMLQDLTRNKLTVRPFTEASPSVNNLTIRLSGLSSPYNNSYSEYLTRALEEELKVAGLFDPNSGIVITGTLIDNQMDASGFSVGTASMTALIEVSKEGKMVFKKEITVNHQWPSSFLGAIAIPAAQNNYPVMVQNFFTKLFNDRDFISAIR